MYNQHTETLANAWKRRRANEGQVDFTMMYVAHDAFNRDLSRLMEANTEGRGFSTEAAATWTQFSKQLHTHHTAEDTALWPRLRAAVTDPEELDILDAMEAEHSELDPRIDQIQAALMDRRADHLESELGQLAAGLAAHMRHEEDDALRLLERRLGQPGWDAFSREVREQSGGLRAGAEYLPWVLDGASDDVRRNVLKLLPGPARLLYRWIWEPKYRNAGYLT